jgi:N-methylhydantoinase A
VAPVASGVLSALGLVVSERRRDVVESVLLAGDDLTRERVAEIVARLGERGREEMDAPDAELRATYELRYAGQAFELAIEGELEPDPGGLRRDFDVAHDERYGYDDPDAELELVTVRVTAGLPGTDARETEPEDAEERGTRELRFGDEVVEAMVLGQGRAEVDGPAIFELPGATLVVPAGWRAEGGGDAVVMEKT